MLYHNSHGGQQLQLIMIILTAGKHASRSTAAANTLQAAAMLMSNDHSEQQCHSPWPTQVDRINTRWWSWTAPLSHHNSSVSWNIITAY